MKKHEDIIELLKIDIERNEIIKEHLKEMNSLIDRIESKYSYRDSLFNVILKKLGISYKVKETKCINGVHTYLDGDREFIKGLNILFNERRDRIIKHAEKFINSES